MSDKYFIDTNILVYSLDFDQKSAAKQATAERLVANALEDRCGIISTQVVQEFLNTALRKFAHLMTIKEAKAYLETVLMPLCAIFPNTLLYEHSLDLQNKTGYSFYDSLIIAAALEGGCRLLYSEDLQHGQTIERKLTIRNPFLEAEVSPNEFNH